MISLFDALFTLLAEEGPAVQPHQVNAILADPECMAERVARLRLQMDDEGVPGPLAGQPKPALEAALNLVDRLEGPIGEDEVRRLTGEEAGDAVE